MAKKVLVVEDHADIRKMMTIFLKLNGYEVVEARDGYEAVEVALEQSPDLILMDLAMPVLDGVYSARAMRDNEELADVPILCVTAYSDFYREKAKAAGCNAVLEKPINFEKLDNLIQQHMH
jgi:two-component system cell cycle response regulator DivK